MAGGSCCIARGDQLDLCDNLEGWDREGGIGRVGGEAQEEGLWG